jgi:hypothetical protein
LDVSRNGTPDLLTVEEAAAVLRIGRTKAYAMATEYRASDGRVGLPVIDLGSVLRVPRRRLEEMVGAPITVIPQRSPRRRPAAAATSDVAPTALRRRSRPRPAAPADQPALFPPDPAA